MEQVQRRKRTLRRIVLFRKTKALMLKERWGGKVLLVIAQKGGNGDKFQFSGNSDNFFFLLSPVELAGLCLTLTNPQKNVFDSVHSTEADKVRTLRVSLSKAKEEAGIEFYLTDKTNKKKRSVSFTLTKPESYLLLRFCQAVIDSSFYPAPRPVSEDVANNGVDVEEEIDSSVDNNVVNAVVDDTDEPPMDW